VSPGSVTQRSIKTEENGFALVSKVAGHGSLPAVLWVGLFLVDVALIAGLEVERVKAALQDTLYTGCQLTDKEERRFFIRQNHLDNKW
jgi:hypothetical protein